MKEGRSKDYLKGSRHGRSSNHFQLEKFLISRIGNHWDQVYAEFCEEFDKRTYVGQQFFKSLKWQVELNCWKGAESGNIYDSKSQEVHGFYVHPLSGCLSYNRPPSYKNPFIDYDKEPERIIVDSTQAYEKIEGIWYYTRYIKNEEYFYAPYKKPSYTIYKKRQLNRKELKSLGLKNNFA